MNPEIKPKRDFVGYGRRRPQFRWPGGASVAVSFVLNYEEGSEQSVLDGDAMGESLAEVARTPKPGERDLSMESNYAYGSRIGAWRILDVFDSRQMPISVYACAVAVERNPDMADYLRHASHEIISHGYRWEEVTKLSREQERDHILWAVESFERTTGKRPRGWYCRYAPSQHTRDLLIEVGGFDYDCDSYADDLPFMEKVGDQDWCVVPHAFDTNDLKFWRGGMITADHFYTYLRDSFDNLARAGFGAPGMMTISLHARVIGRPGRIAAIERFADYVRNHPDAWIATRGQIADAFRTATTHKEIA